jgi:hypothetical protein
MPVWRQLFRGRVQLPAGQVESNGICCRGEIPFPMPLDWRFCFPYRAALNPVRPSRNSQLAVFLELTPFYMTHIMEESWP